MHDSSLPALVRRLVPLFNADKGSARRLDPGAIAELRRLVVDGPDGAVLDKAAYWAVVADLIEQSMPPDGNQEARRWVEDRWAMALNAMAILADLYREGHRLGVALAAAGYSEQRLQRLLGCPDDRLAVEIQTAARYLAAKGEAVDYYELTALALTQDPKKAEDVRRGIARDYFRTLAKQSKDKG